MKGTQRDEGDGRILLDDNTGGGTFVLRQITFQCADVWISTGLLGMYAYSYIVEHMCT